MNGPTFTNVSATVTTIKNGTVFVRCSQTGLTDHEDLRVKNDITIAAINGKYLDRFATEDTYAN